METFKTRLSRIPIIYMTQKFGSYIIGINPGKTIIKEMSNKISATHLKRVVLADNLHTQTLSHANTHTSKI